MKCAEGSSCEANLFIFCTSSFVSASLSICLFLSLKSPVLLLFQQKESALREVIFIATLYF